MSMCVWRVRQVSGVDEQRIMAGRPLEHLVLISIAATGNADEGDEGQIVLLAWQTLSIAKNQIVSKDQVYVCPQEGVSGRSQLPTGITQDMLRDAKSLESALGQLHASISKLSGSAFSLMTNGPLPLRHILHPEAYKGQIKLGSYFNQYFDINKEFSKCFPDTPVLTDLEQMSEFLQIAFSGNSSQAGLPEVELMCEIARKLISQGHVFQSPDLIKQVDLTATPNTALVTDKCVVKLIGLPFKAKPEEVAGFLSGLNCIPGGVVFGINGLGRRNGEAIVVLESPEEAELAFKRNNHYLKQRYIELFEATPEDFLRLAGSEDDNECSVFIVKMQGLPYKATKADIVDFFEGSAPVFHGQDGVFIVHLSDVRVSGDAFALFATQEDQDEALKLHNSTMGSRYVELFSSSIKEFKLVLGRSGLPQQQRHFSSLLGLTLTGDPELEGLKGRERKCVKLRGLPWSCTPEDVVQFFGDLKDNIATKGVHLVVNATNRATGDCYVQMTSVEAAKKASEQLHKQYIGSRYVDVFQCSGDEVYQAMQDQGSGGGGGRGRGDRRRQVSGGSGGSNVVKARGLPFSIKEEKIADFFAEYDVVESDVELIYNQSGSSTGIAYITFSSRGLAQRAVREKDRKHIGSRYVELSLN